MSGTVQVGRIVESFPYLDLIWNDDCRALISRWRGGFAGRSIREGLDAALAEFQRRGPNAQWIGDTSDIGVIDDEHKIWIDQNWFPRFLATDVRFMAVVQPSKVVAKMSVNAVVSKIPDTRLTIYNCASIGEAITWMKAQQY